MREQVRFIKSGKYTLVARLYNGAYHGFLWHGGKVIDNDVASSIEEAWEMVFCRLYERLSGEADRRKDLPPSSLEACDAFINIASRLSVGQKAMLRQHLTVEGRQLTATQLAAAANYRGFSATNLQYGLLGAMLYGEMPRLLPLNKNGKPVMTCMIADGVENDGRTASQWTWRMRDEIAEGLTASKIL